MKIEPIIENDLLGLLEIFNLSREANESFARHEFSLDEFTSAIEGEDVLVARIGGEMAGFVSIWRPDNFLHHLFVSPKHQRKGVGKALIFESIRKFGLPMSLKCIKANTNACHFYEQLGWQAKKEDVGPDGPYIHYYLEKYT